MGSYGGLVCAGKGDCLDQERVDLREEGRNCRGCCGSRPAETEALHGRGGVRAAIACVGVRGRLPCRS